jgi:DNA-binding NarL/FixJ family response regulator
MLSILLVEDHLIFASVMVRLLNRMEEVKAVDVASTAERALQELAQHEFDLAIIDVSLPKMNGLNLVSLIISRYPDLPCLMLSGHALPHYVQRALSAGARGYILKDDSAEIVEGIQHVLNGEVYISPGLRDRNG